jgi:hypothetical protein
LASDLAGDSQQGRASKRTQLTCGFLSCKRCLHLDITVSVTKTLRWINGLRYLRSLCIPFKLKMQFINNKAPGVATIGVDGVNKISRFKSRAKYKKDALRLQLSPERARWKCGGSNGLLTPQRDGHSVSNQKCYSCVLSMFPRRPKVPVSAACSRDPQVRRTREIDYLTPKPSGCCEALEGSGRLIPVGSHPFVSLAARDRYLSPVVSRIFRI